MSKNIFSYNRFISPICKKLTHHKHRRLISWDKSFSNNNYRHPNKHDFYYKCKICGYVFFNNKPSVEELNYIKEYDKKHKEE
jgi:hypothetical protein